MNDSRQPLDTAENLRVSTLAMDIAEGLVSENLRRAHEMLMELPAGTDLAVLPELFTTSFMRDHRLMAEYARSQAQLTVETLRGWASEFMCVIAGSFIAKSGPKMVNRGFMVKPDGTIHFYNKRHLFCLSPESSLLKAGEEVSMVVEYKGWRITLIICYDLRFPAWCREAGYGSDLLLVPANWPSARDYAWRQLLIARAIENQQYVIGADRGGSDSFGDYDGMSMITDPLGRPMDTRTKQTEFGQIRSAELSRASLDTLRHKMPFLKDADAFKIF